MFVVLVTVMLNCLLGAMSFAGVHGEASIRLLETTYSVREGDQFTIQVEKTGTAASPVNVVIEVSVIVWISKR